MMEQEAEARYRLRTTTIDAARHLGMDAHIGSIEVGKLADIAVINGDILADFRQSDRVTYTMVNGRLFDADTMQEMGPTARPRQPFYFEE